MSMKKTERKREQWDEVHLSSCIGLMQSKSLFMQIIIMRHATKKGANKWTERAVLGEKENSNERGGRGGGTCCGLI